MSKRSIRKRRHLAPSASTAAPFVADVVYRPTLAPYDPANWRTFESREDLRRACETYMVKP